MSNNHIKPVDYKQAGVDIRAGEEAVIAIKDRVRSTFNSNVLSELGSFGGLYRIDKEAWEDPILVASTDGVGTKLLLAVKSGIYNTVGQDLVNHCVNDILVQGALPQFFLDYIGVGKLSPDVISDIIDGFVKACRENSCALIGGEMAEMPGLYQPQDFDLAGTIVGMVEKKQLLPRKNIAAGDLLLGMPSSGLHTNGYSLARKVLFDGMKLEMHSRVDELSGTLGDALLQVHTSYLKPLRGYLCNPGLKALAHITGGGIASNLARVLPDDLAAEIKLDESRIPAIFHLIQKGGNVSQDVMRQTFNLGIGMVCVMSPALAEQFSKDQDLQHLGELIPAKTAGKVWFR